MPAISPVFRPIVLSTAMLCALVATSGCEKKDRDKSDAAAWIDSPSAGTKNGNVITIPQLGVKFEIPDTLYVFKSCGEAAHTPEGDHGWVPVVTCRSTSGETFGGGGEGGEGEDPFAGEDAEEASGVEEIAVTFYVTQKTRPLDERAVSWFENQFKQSGLGVDEISYQHEFQKKAGIYAKLHVVDSDGTAPEREIIQFMFPRRDVVFIARMEYPFGEKRSVDQDWKYILWNFEFVD
jgi:hypothetical protein